MSNFTKPEYCYNCEQTTDHNWYDNTPKHHEYTVECQKCKLRTHEDDWEKDKPLKDKYGEGHYE